MIREKTVVAKVVKTFFTNEVFDVDDADAEMEVELDAIEKTVGFQVKERYPRR